MPSAVKPATARRDPRWRRRAACRGHDPEIWFPPPPRPYATRREHADTRRARIAAEERAKAICAVCPVSLECLEFAMDNDIKEGVYGGMTPTERGKIPLR